VLRRARAEGGNLHRSGKGRPVPLRPPLWRAIRGGPTGPTTQRSRTCVPD